jgi:hypothetical protein
VVDGGKRHLTALDVARSQILAVPSFIEQKTISSGEIRGEMKK